MALDTTINLVGLSTNWLKYVYTSASSTGSMSAVYEGVTLSSSGSTLKFIGYDSHQGYYVAAAKIRSTNTLTSNNPLTSSNLPGDYYGLVGELVVTQYNFSSDSDSSGHSTIAWKVSTIAPSVIKSNGYNYLNTLTNVVYSSSLAVSGFGTNNSSYPGYITFVTPPLKKSIDYYIYFYTTDSTLLNCSFCNRLYAAPVSQIFGSTNLEINDSDFSLSYQLGNGGIYKNSNSLSSTAADQIDLTIPASTTTTKVTTANQTAQNNFITFLNGVSLGLGDSDGHVTVGGKADFIFSVSDKKYKIIGWKADSDDLWDTDSEESYTRTSSSETSLNSYLVAITAGRYFKMRLIPIDYFLYIMKPEQVNLNSLSVLTDNSEIIQNDDGSYTIPYNTKYIVKAIPSFSAAWNIPEVSGTMDASDITIVLTETALSNCYIYIDSKWQITIPYIYDGIEWKRVSNCKIYDTEWKG